MRLPAASGPAMGSLPRLAYVSPLPPVPSGIADYSAELLPALALHFAITVVVEQVDAQVPPGFAVIDSAAFLRQAAQFDHVLYHVGNSPYHAHMVGLLRRVPGVVVLHDVYLGHLFAHIQESGRDPVALRRALWQSHGMAALACWRSQGLDVALQRYPASAEVLAQARGVIVHSQHARRVLEQAGGAPLAVPVHVVPLPQAMPARVTERAAARRRLGIPEDVFLVCSFGYAGPGKLTQALVQAWHEAGLAEQPLAWLRLVGGHQLGGASAQALDDELGRCIRTQLTGYVDAATYQDHLAAADLAVQLRTQSRGETSRAVLEVIAHGIPLLLNAHGANAEVPAAWVEQLDETCPPAALAAALADAHAAPARWRERAEQARAELAQRHGPVPVARQYAASLEAIHNVGADALAWAREPLRRQVMTQGRLPWHVAHRRLAALAVAVPPGVSRRWRPPLESLTVPPRRAFALAQVGSRLASVDVLVVTGASLAPPRHGDDRRSAALIDAYRQAGWQVTLVPPGHDAVREPAASPRHVIHIDVAADGGWAALADLPAGAACRVVSLPRYLVPAEAREGAALATRVDLLICHDEVQAAAWRPIADVCVVPDGYDPLVADGASTLAACAATLSRQRFAVVPGSAVAPTVAAFDHLLLQPSLAYLPLDVRLILVGRLGDAMREHAGFQRWAGINLTRGMIAGCLDEISYEAARRHAWVKVILPGRGRPGTGLALRLREALQDPGWILTTTATLAGADGIRRDPRVWVEDDPGRLRQRLVQLLKGPPAPAPAAEPSALTWSQAVASLPVAVAERLLRVDAGRSP